MRVGKITFVLVCFSVLFFADINAQSSVKQRNAKTQTPKLTPQDIAESGEYFDNVYSNKPLKLTVSIPSGWNLLSDEVNRTLLKEGWKDIRKAEPQKYDLSKSQLNTKILFQAVSPLSSDQKTVDVLSLGIELLTTLQSQEAYARFNRDLVLKTLSGKLTRDFYSRTIGGERFTGFDIDVVANGAPMKQTYLVKRRENLMLFFVLTFGAGSSTTTEFNTALNTLKFTN